MSEKDDGGPAVGHGSPATGCASVTTSLREWIAGQALATASFLATHSVLPNGEENMRHYESISYAMADAMLAERAK